MDLGFLIDTSVTSKTDLLSQKKYIKRIVEGFAISESGARAGLVLFADRATLNIKLSDHYSVASFIKAVNRIPLKNSLNPVRFGGALNVAYTQLFNEKNGGRRNVPQLIIVLSAGKQDASGLSLSKQVSAIHEAGIKVIVLGIGSAVNRDQIATIGKVPENIFFAKDFKELTSDEFIRNTSTRACLNAGKYLFAIRVRVSMTLVCRVLKS